MHRAKQMDYPDCGKFNTGAIYIQTTKDQDPRCHFGRQTTSRPFFGPLQTSCSGSVQKTRAQTARTQAAIERRATVRGLTGTVSLF